MSREEIELARDKGMDILRGKKGEDWKARKDFQNLVEIRDKGSGCARKRASD